MPAGRERDDDPIALIEAKVASGELDRDQVSRARELWERQLRDGIAMLSGEHVTITERRLHHVLLREPRILRKPERIERLLARVSEIYSAHTGRRAALSQWREAAGTIYGYAILDDESNLRTAHVVDAKKHRKLARQGELLWKREGSPSFGKGQTTTF